MITALVFDMDGLLLDSEQVVKRSWDEAGKEMGIRELGSHIVNTLGLNRAGRNEYFRRAFGENFPIEEFNEKTHRHFFRIVEKEGIARKAGAKELLEYAKAHNYKIAIATSSGREYSIDILKTAGLWEYFDGGIFGDMVENTKPHPEIYRKACAAIGKPCGSCLALEDSPAGVRSAHAAGMRVIVVPDLVEPPEDVLALAYKRCGTLFDVLAMFENGQL